MLSLFLKNMRRRSWLLLAPLAVANIYGLNLLGKPTVWVSEEAGKVKTFAIVSVACTGLPKNYNDKEPEKAPVGSGKEFLGAVAGSSLANAQPENLPNILSQGLAAMRAELADTLEWQDAGFGPEGNAHIDRLFQTGSTSAVARLRNHKEELVPNYLAIPPRLVSGKDKRLGAGLKVISAKDLQKELAGLADAMGVDAVGLLRFDLAYTGLVSKSSKALFNNARANVGVELVLVSRGGELILKTDDRGEAILPRYTGGTLGRVVQGEVVLNDKAMEAYGQALASAAKGLKESILKAHAKR